MPESGQPPEAQAERHSACHVSARHQSGCSRLLEHRWPRDRRVDLSRLKTPEAAPPAGARRWVTAPKKRVDLARGRLRLGVSARAVTCTASSGAPVVKP